MSGTDAALFTIGTNDGQLRVATGAQLDFETRRTLRVTVEVSDGANSLGDPDSDAIDDRQNVTITLTDVNEAPVVAGDASPSVAENANRTVAAYTGTDPERDPLTWSVSDTDKFWISSGGQLHFVSPPSYEDGASHNVTITVEDERGLSSALEVTVTVTDVEEAGAVTIEPRRGWDGTTFTAEMEDDDNVVGIADWQWQHSSNRSSWGDISGATSSSYTAGADDINQYLRATASYEDDRGSGKEASAEVAGRIGDSTGRSATNSDPEFTETAPVTRTVASGTAAGRNIGSPVRADDDDPGEILTYSLLGSDAGLFEIDTASGQLKTLAVLEYDPEGTNTYEVQVSVHDGFDDGYDPDTGVDDTIEVTITVTEAAQRRSTSPGSSTSPEPDPEPEPEVSTVGGGGAPAAPQAPSFAAGGTTTLTAGASPQPGDVVGDPVVATSPGATSISYSLSGDDAPLFTVDDETGQIRVALETELVPGQTYTVSKSSELRGNEELSAGGKGV